MKNPTYADSQMIHAGDRIRHAGRPAVVLAVLDTHEFASDRDRAQWDFLEKGFVISEAETNETYHYQEADEDIELVSRADSRRHDQQAGGE